MKRDFETITTEDLMDATNEALIENKRIKAEQLRFNKSVNDAILWEQRRYEIARDIIPAIYRMEFTTSSRDAICGYAIKYADELIKQLKGE